MKITKKLAAVAVSTLMMFSVAGMNVFAASTTQDGLEVSLTTDKEAYSKDEKIIATLSVKNTNASDVTDVSLETLIPDGYEIDDNSANTKRLDKLAPNESTELKVVYVAGDSGENSQDSEISQVSEDSEISQVSQESQNSEVSTVSPSKDSPKTGDNTVIPFVIVLVMLVSVLLAVLCFKSKKGRKLLSFFFVLTVMNGAFCLELSDIKASALSRIITVNETVSVNGVDTVLTGKLTYTADIRSEVPAAVLEGETSTLDSDGDGLTDYQEYCLTNTNPFMKSTGNDGVNDSERDEDGDTINNITEIQNGTNPLLADSDSDGLNDWDEQTLGTNPLLADTDGDGASDGWEHKKGYDPLVFNPVFQTEESASTESITASVKLKDDGVCASNLKISKSDNVLLNNNIAGYVGSAFDFETKGNISSAEITFEFDEALFEDENFDPAIYYYNEETQMLEELNTTVESNKASATVEHFSTYVLLDKKTVNEVWEEYIRRPGENVASNGVSIAFVLDRSLSMDWNDPDNLRNSLTTQFINKLSEETDKGGIVSFIADATVVASLTNDKDTLKAAVDSIVNDDGWHWNSGTNGSAGIHAGLEELENDNSGNTRYLLFMTDGEDNRTSYSYDELISTAQQDHVTIYTIGLGSVNSEILEKVATETGGRYYYASNADDLLEGYLQAEQETIDYHTDSNQDGISDYYTKLLCEGRLITGTGLNIFNGVSYEDIQANDDYDGDGVKNGAEIKILESGDRVYVYMISDPESKDTDEDGILDDEDTAPREKGLVGGIIGELTIVSCHPDGEGFTSGHAWLSYKSYVDDTLNISGLLNGYLYDYSTKGFYNCKVDNYEINRNGHIAIGNAGTNGTSGALSTITGSCGGILYNREFYGEWANNNFYTGVAAYTRTVTQDEYDAVMNYCTSNCYYNLYSHNCSTVAANAWKAAFGSGDGFEASGLLFDTPQTLKENILKKSEADSDYRATMLNIIANWV